jgi:predicted dehydrogenase
VNVVRIGLIGAGFMGRTNAEVVSRYVRGAKLVAITGGSRAESLAAAYGLEYEATVESLIARGDIDAVLISTPHTAHEHDAVTALRAGKHILLDKPMATSVAACDAILAAAARTGAKVMPMFSQRFRDCNIAARRLVEEGTVGEIRMVQEFCLASGGLGALPAWQSLPENIGIFIGHAIHNIDRVRWLTGAEVANVSAQVRRDPISGNEVSTMALLGLTNGGMASIWASWEIALPVFPGSESSGWYAGERGNLDLDAYGELRVGREDGWRVAAVQPPIDWAGAGALSPVRLESYGRQCQEFVNAIVEGREPCVTGRDGRAAIEIAVAAYRSGAEGCTITLR